MEISRLHEMLTDRLGHKHVIWHSLYLQKPRKP